MPTPAAKRHPDTAQPTTVDRLPGVGLRPLPSTPPSVDERVDGLPRTERAAFAHAGG